MSTTKYNDEESKYLSRQDLKIILEGFLAFLEEQERSSSPDYFDYYSDSNNFDDNPLSSESKLSQVYEKPKFEYTYRKRPRLEISQPDVDYADISQYYGFESPLHIGSYGVMPAG